jgi:hypothetical protein
MNITDIIKNQIEKKQFYIVTSDPSIYVVSLRTVSKLSGKIFPPLSVKKDDLTVLDPYPSDIAIAGCNLTSLEGLPTRISGYLSISKNESLTSLKGCAQYVGTNFIAESCNILTIDSLPRYVGTSVSLHDNYLQSLQNIHKVCIEIKDMLYVASNPIKSHVLGVMLIENLNRFRIDHGEVEKIINRHLKTDRDVFLCQDNLIKAGFAEHAQL